MADEKQEVQETAEESEESRNELLGKAASAAGTLSIAGLVASLLNTEADAQLTSGTGGSGTLRQIGNLKLETQRLNNERRFNLSGKNLAAALGRESMIPGADRAAEVGVGFSVKF